MNIPTDAVEAAAKKLDELNSDAGDQLSDKDWALEILEAAAPFIAAQAWDEGEHAGYMNNSAEQRHGVEPHVNPYRSQQ